MMIFCTLFDSNYLDKGLVMYRSLQRHAGPFRLYILAMDDRCEEILQMNREPGQVILNLDEFTGAMKLEEIRKTRSRGEFCWTCSSHLIDYVITRCGEESCTYLDSDLYFFSDPQVLLDEMGDRTVQIVEHRFADGVMGKIRKAESGTYCVEFNTFRNRPDAMELLRWWEEQCRESCSSVSDGKVFGDQLYLENWGSRKEVSVLQHPGGGVAPWNLSRYRWANCENQNDPIILKEDKSGKEIPLVFYHFHNLQYRDRYHVNMGIYDIWKADEQLIRRIYLPYLKEIDKEKGELEKKFGFMPLLTRHPGLPGKEQKGTQLTELLCFIKRIMKPRGFAHYINAKKAIRHQKRNLIEFEP